MPGRRDSADRLTGRLAHLLRRRALDPLASEPLGERRGVDAVRAARHDEERLAVRPEDQAVRDRAHLDAERGGRERRGGRGIREHDDVAGDAGRAKRVVDEAAAGGEVRGQLRHDGSA